MENTIRDTLEKDIGEMLDFIVQNPHWKNCLASFEYEFMVNEDGRLVYEQWKDCNDELPVGMEANPLFMGLKNLNYTGVCFVRFHQTGHLLSEELTDDDYTLEVVLTNPAYHLTPALHHPAEVEEPPTLNMLVLTDGSQEDDKYLFPLSKELKIRK